MIIYIVVKSRGFKQTQQKNEFEVIVYLYRTLVFLFYFTSFLSFIAWHYEIFYTLSVLIHLTICCRPLQTNRFHCKQMHPFEHVH